MLRRRLVVVELDDPCRKIGESSKALLYSLIVSHGIRVDTELLVATPTRVYAFQGRLLRHLYPQEPSLRGFARAVFCRGKKLPGVFVIERQDLRMVLADRLRTCRSSLLLCLTEDGDVIDYCAPYRDMPTVDCVVIGIALAVHNSKRLCASLEPIVSRASTRALTIKVKAIAGICSIAVAHFILDASYGCLLRRRGGLEYARGICEEDKC